jgi:hypothetical protein
MPPAIRSWAASPLRLLVRTYASKAKSFKPLYPLRLPEQFRQRIVLSDGSSMVVRSTSPRPYVKLNRDTHNHMLWNPALMRDHLDRENQQMSKFSRRFAGMDFEDVDDDGLDAHHPRDGAAPSEGGEEVK